MTGAFGKAYSPFLPTVSVAPLAIYSTRSLKPGGYSGNLITLNRIADNSQITLAALANGDADVSGVSAFLNGASFCNTATVTEQMGSGFDAAQATQAAMPFFSLKNNVGGKQTVTFDGNQNTGYLNIPAGVTGDANTFTIFNVAMHESTNAGVVAEVGAALGTAGSISIGLGRAATSALQPWTSSNFSNSASIQTRAQMQVTAIVSAGDKMQCFGDLHVSNASSINNAGTWAGGIIGKDSAGNVFNGEWCATIIYPGILSTTEVQTIMAALSSIFNCQQTNSTLLILAGNSIVQGTKATMNFNCPRQAEPLFSRRIHMRNLGVFGQTVQTEHGAQANYVAMCTAALAAGYSKVLFVLGEPTNDIGTSAASGNIAAPSTAGGGGSGSVGTNVWNNWSLPDIQAIQAVIGAANVLVPTTLARGWSGSSTDKTQREAAAQDWRNLVAANQATYGYTILDYHSITAMQNPNDGVHFDSGDLTHPTTAGYLLMANSPAGQGLAATVNTLM